MLVNPSVVNNNCVHSWSCGCQNHSSDKRWMEGTHDMLYKNLFFFVTFGPNQTGSSLTGKEIVRVSYHSMTFYIAIRNRYLNGDCKFLQNL